MRSFKLLVESNSPTCWVSGPLGSTVEHGCGPKIDFRRNSLPPQIDDLTFNLMPHCAVSAKQSGLNFSLLRDFLIADDEIRRFLKSNSGASFEERMVHCLGDRGRNVTGEFWAMKIISRVECIDPYNSTAGEWSNETRKTEQVSFKDRLLEFKLSEDVAPYFANTQTGTYRSYPTGFVRQVALIDEAIPPSLKLFEALNWPGRLFIDSMFSKALLSRLRGSALGYYYWELGLDDVSTNHYSLSYELW